MRNLKKIILIASFLILISISIGAVNESNISNEQVDIVNETNQVIENQTDEVLIVNDTIEIIDVNISLIENDTEQANYSDDDRGHGNDPDGCDEDNPGQGCDRRNETHGPNNQTHGDLMETLILLILDKVSVIKGEMVGIQAYLLYENNSPVIDQGIEFYADDQNLGTQITDTQGLAEMLLNTSPLVEGMYTIKANYSGSESLEGSFTSSEINISKGDDDDDDLNQTTNSTLGNNTCDDFIIPDLPVENCVPDWVELRTSCRYDNTILGFYVDVNDCYFLTGNESDRQAPENNTYPCKFEVKKSDLKAPNYLISKDGSEWGIQKQDYISRYLDFDFIYLNDDYYRVEWRWKNDYVKDNLQLCTLVNGGDTDRCVNKLKNGNNYIQDSSGNCIETISYTKQNFTDDYFEENNNFLDIDNDVENIRVNDMPNLILKGNAEIIGLFNPAKRRRGSFYIKLNDGFMESNGLQIKFGSDSLLIEFNNTRTEEILDFYGNNTVDEEREWTYQNACSDDCNYAVDENWGSSARPYAAGSPYLTDIFENFTVPHWATSAKWRYKSGWLVGTRATQAFCYNHDSSTYQQFSQNTNNGATVTVNIPSACLKGDTLITRTRISKAGPGSVPESIYHEGAVIWLFDDVTRYLNLDKDSNVTSATLKVNGSENYVMDSYEFYPVGDSYHGGVHFNGSYIWIIWEAGGLVRRYYLNGSYTDTWDIGEMGGDPMTYKQYNHTFYYLAEDYYDKIHLYHEPNHAGLGQVDVSSTDSYVRGAWFNGTYFWYVGRTTRHVYRYNASGSYNDWNFSVASEMTYPYDVQLYGDYFWVSSTKDQIFRYNLSGSYDDYYTNFSQGSSGVKYGFSYNGSHFLVFSGERNIYIIYRYAYSTLHDPFLEVGTADGDYEWNYSGEFNRTHGTNITEDFTTEINSYLASCTPDGNNYCQVPLVFNSRTGGKLKYSDINIVYNVPPIFVTNTTDDSNITNKTNRGSNVTFTANISDFDNDSVKLVICDDSGRIDTNCTGTRYCYDDYDTLTEKNCSYDTSDLTLDSYNWTSFACDNTSLCRDGENGTFYISHIPKDPKMFVNHTNVWNYAGYFSGPEQVEDWGDELNDTLQGCDNSSQTCDIPLNFSSDEKGILNIYNIDIQYTLADKYPPVVHNITIIPSPAQVQDVLNITVNATDNLNISSVNASMVGSFTNLTYNETSKLYEGNLTAPGTAGNYTITIISVDQTNLTTINYTYLTVSSDNAELIVYPEYILFNVTEPDENQTIQINGTIFNEGDATPDSLEVELLIDYNVVDSEMTTVSAHSNKTISFNWLTTPGDHNVTIRATGCIYEGIGCDEDNESNNNATTTLFVYDLSPPTIHEIITNSPIIEGQSLTIQVNATDNANISEVEALINGTTLILVYNETSKLYENSTDIIQDGTHILEVTAKDVNDLVSNKQVQVTVNSNTGNADLLLNIQDISFSEQVIKDGDSITISANITNNGGTDANNFKVQFLIDDIPQQNNTVSVSANSKTLTQFGWNTSYGNYTLTFKIDVDSDITETNESNNEIDKNVSVIDIEIPFIHSVIINEPVYESSTLKIRVNATDDVNISIVNATIDSDEFTLPYNETSKLYDGSTTAPATNGVYNVTIKAVDHAGLSSELKIQLTVYDTSPDLTLDYEDLVFDPIASEITDNITLKINATIHNNGGSDANNFVVELLVDSISEDTNTISVSKASNYTTTLEWINTTYGSHNLTIRADSNDDIAESDETNNEINRSIFVLDVTAPPILSLTADPDNWTTETTFNISWGNVSDENGLLRYEYQIDYGAFTSNGLTTSFITPTQTDGVHIVYVRAVDNSGNEGDLANVTIHIDNSNPNIPVIREWHCGNNWTQHNTAYLSWVDPGDIGSGVTNFTVSIDDGGEINLASNLTYHSQNLTTGNHTFKVKAYDALNHSSSWSNIVTVYVDTSEPDSPDLSSTTHPDNETWYKTTTPIFNISGPTDDSGIGGYFYVIDKNATTTPDNMNLWTTNTTLNVTNLGGGSTYGLNGTNGTNLTGIPSGEWYFHIIAQDNAGNLGNNASHYKFMIDTTGPAIISYSPANNSNVTDKTPTFTVEYTDYGIGVNVSSIIFEVDDSDVTGDSIYNTTLLTYTPSSSLGLGEHNATIYLEDNLTNSKIFTWLFNVTEGTSSDSKSTSEWLMFRRYLNHTGVYTGSVNMTDLGLLWSYATFDGNQTARILSSPSVWNDTVFFGADMTSGLTNIYALDAGNGSLKWNYSYGTYPSMGPFSSPAVVDDIVYIGGADGNIYALWANNGTKKWNKSMGSSIIWSSSAVINNNVLIGSTDNNVYALNASSGSKIWNYNTSNDIFSSPAIVDDIVYVGGQEGTVYAFWIDNGTQKWNYSTGAPVFSSPAIVDDIVYVGGNDNNVYALNASSGSKIWNYSTGDDVYSSPAVVDDIVYVGSDNHNFYALWANNGTKIWNYSTGGRIISSPAVSANGIVFFGSYDNKIYGLNTSDGEKIWEYTTDAYVRSSPAIVDGIIYVGSDDGKLYAFRYGVGYDLTYLVNSTTTTVYNHLNGTLNNLTYNISLLALDLKPGNTTGSFVSKIFNALSSVTWNNISWLSNTGELPNYKKSNPTISMIDNVLLLHLNNDSNYNENDTLAADTSGNGNHAWFKGLGEPKVNTTDCKFGNCLTFDGSDDYINITDYSLLDGVTDLTVALWFKQSSLAVNKAFITKWDHPIQDSWAFQTHYQNNDEIMVFIANSLTDNGANRGSTTDTNLVAGKWYHAVFVYDADGATNADKLKIYVNGTEKSVSYDGTIPSSLQESVSSVKIGRFGGILTRYFNGNIDEVAIWNRSLTAEEVSDIYKRGYLKLNMSVRSCNDAICDTESWVDIIDTSPQDLSIDNYQWFQYKAEFNTTNISYSPELYNVTVKYTN